VPRRYRSPALVKVGTDPSSSNGDGITRTGWIIAVKAVRATTSAAGGNTDYTLVEDSRRAVSLPIRTVLAFSEKLEHFSFFFPKLNLDAFVAPK
jgi:hypothetical protein